MLSNGHQGLSHAYSHVDSVKGCLEEELLLQFVPFTIIIVILLFIIDILLAILIDIVCHSILPFRISFTSHTCLAISINLLDIISSGSPCNLTILFHLLIVPILFITLFILLI